MIKVLTTRVFTWKRLLEQGSPPKVSNPAFSRQACEPPKVSNPVLKRHAGEQPKVSNPELKRQAGKPPKFSNPAREIPGTV